VPESLFWRWNSSNTPRQNGCGVASSTTNQPAEMMAGKKQISAPRGAYLLTNWRRLCLSNHTKEARNSGLVSFKAAVTRLSDAVNGTLNARCVDFEIVSKGLHCVVA